jgi:predicted AlkP superfamily pyrophosphatase or phosphodiesterase
MKKVVVLVMDGCRNDKIKEASTPNIDQIIEKGIYVKDCSTVFPSITGAAQMSLLCGAYPERTGLTGHFFWDAKNKIHDLNNPEYCEVKTIFDVLESHKLRSLSQGPRVAWNDNSASGLVKKSLRKISKKISTNQNIMLHPFFGKLFSAFRHNRILSTILKGNKDILSYLKNKDISFFYLVLTDPDKAGHEFGSDSMEYKKAIERMDKNVGRLLDKMDDDTLAVITSDHGQCLARVKVAVEDIPFHKIGYHKSDTKKHALGKEILIATFVNKKLEKIRAIFVTRHLELWFENKEDIEKFIEEVQHTKFYDKIIRKEDARQYHFYHKRLSDLVITLKEGFGFSVNHWEGDHGGFSEAEMKVPLFFWHQNIEKKEIETASIIDIAPTVYHFLNIPVPKECQGKNLLEPEKKIK